MNRDPSNHLAISCAVGLSALALAGAARPAQLSDQLIVKNSAGKVVKIVRVYEVSSAGVKETLGFHAITGVKFNKSLYGAYIGLIEPVGNLSDIVGIHNSGTASAPRLFFGFSSDTETQGPNPKNGWTLPGVAGTLIPEKGPVDVTRFLDTSAGSGQVGWTATFASDVTNAAATRTNGVPEPAAWALMLSGLGALGAALRARRSPPAVTWL
ncbi:MAG TPA: PEPxxWA-CTERM sorting domain-containing protein [Caulobacteraceae bacterium]|nr:PEPxxWA-CTERM sorting domain-containing protein [Caulobacteraceae bacterium]